VSPARLTGSQGLDNPAHRHHHQRRAGRPLVAPTGADLTAARLHSHPCAHGVYVLEGTLNTHQGDYPAGSFVWFPEGGVMQHGATQDQDVTFLFITNKAFDIHSVDDENDPHAPTM
jgi:hypothetical protein